MDRRLQLIFTSACAVVVFVFAAVPDALGQAGTIAIYSDQSRNNWCYQDSQEGECRFYVFHVGTPGAKASRFKIESAGFTGVFVGDVVPAPNLAIGQSDFGIAVYYDDCTPSPIFVLELIYYCLGDSPNCRTIRVVPDPVNTTGFVEVVDCGPEPKLLVAGSGQVCVNAGCGGLPYTCDCAVPVTGGTWGSIKAQYGSRN